MANVNDSLLPAMVELRDQLALVRLPLPAPGAQEARDTTAAALAQLDDYILPRLRNLDAPILAVVGGSTGSGKSTLVNTLVGEAVTVPGVLRPTTRHPVLVCNPTDRRWFVDDRILPRLPRITGAVGPGGAGAGDVSGLHLVERESVPVGLALLDAPDLDSVSHANRDLAAQLLAAADLWLFVTTAARYADAVPWQALRAAVERDAAVVIVLNRVPVEAMAAVTEDARAMLADEGLAQAPLFAFPETGLLVDSGLPAALAAPLREWLFGLVADADRRAAVTRRTLDGAVGELVGAVGLVAEAAAAQTDKAHELAHAAAVPYALAADRVTESSADGALMRGEVLARWQEFVGTGEVLRKMETQVSRLRDKVGAAFRGEPAPSEGVSEAIESRLATLIVAASHDASRQADSSWRADPAGRALLAGDDLARASPDIADLAAAAVRGWQDDVLELIRAEGADKRQTARLAAYGVNGTAAALMIAAFATTGGITGAEIGIAAGSTILAQKVLEAVFGEGAVRRLSSVARDSLSQRVDAVMAHERARFDVRLDGLELDPELPDALAAAGRRATVAFQEQAAPADLPWGAPLPGSAGGVRSGSGTGPTAESRPATTAKPRWRDRLRDWWDG